MATWIWFVIVLVIAFISFWLGRIIGKRSGKIETKMPLPHEIINPKDLKADQYPILAARNQHFNSLLWQTPVLSLTAQAFLFSIALSKGNDTWAIFISSFLAWRLSRPSQ